MLHFTELFPFPDTELPPATVPAAAEKEKVNAGAYASPGDDTSGFMDVIRNARHAICVENNLAGGFARLVRAETGFEFTDRINKFDGRPFSLEGLLEEIDVFL